MTAPRHLADIFPRAGEADWRELVARAGADPQALASYSDDGIPVGPLYPAGSGSPIAGRTGGRPWTVVQRLDRGAFDATASAARSALRGGATGIALVFPGSPAAHGAGLALDLSRLRRLLEDAGAAGAHLRIEVSEAGAEGLATLAGDLHASGAGDLCLAFDPFAALAVNGHLARPLDTLVGALVSAAEAMDRIGVPGDALVADGRPWHDGGATEAQELAAVLAATVAYLRRAEAAGALEQAARRVAALVSADADQFLTIAKVRAMRLLSARLFELVGFPGLPSRIHAETSWRMMTRRDDHLNMLRTTTAAHAAATGGADSITGLGHRLDGDPFSDRMARNIQTIALDEASLHRVSDPGAGSGAIETLTGELAAAAWASFREIEREGGLAASIRAGAIQARIADKREARLAKVGRREIEIVGVNVQIDRSQPLPARHPAPHAIPPPPNPAETAEPLVRTRLSEPFEHLCDRARWLAEKGAPARVLVIAVGGSSGLAATADAFAAGGIGAIVTEEATTATEFARALDESETPVACAAASGDALVGEIRSCAAVLRQAGAAFVIISGAGETAEPADIGADAFLGPRTDLPALLGKALDAIAAMRKNRQNQTTQ